MTNRPNRQLGSGTKTIGRRDVLKAGGAALVGLALAERMRCPALADAKPVQVKAKSVLQLWLGGGAHQAETFDPKPHSPEDYGRFGFKGAIHTNVKDIDIGEQLPMLAKHADKYSIIRTMTHPVWAGNAHEAATYIVQTGSMPGEISYPSQGAIVGLKKANQAQCGLPPYITITSFLGRFSEAGFLGTAYAPFATGGDPNAKDFCAEGLSPAPGLTSARLADRRSLLQSLDSLGRKMDKETQLQAMNAYRETAYSLVQGEARKAFDLSEEKDDLRERYGRTRTTGSYGGVFSFGQSCLLARRLIERGVPWVTVNWGGDGKLGAWDTHERHFETVTKLYPDLDRGFSALLEDMAERGLLDTTIVVCIGEFGRSPKILPYPPSFGRDHHSACFSAVVAGGGFKGGQVVGYSDYLGDKVGQRPVYPWDLSASLYQLLGIDPSDKIPYRGGRYLPVLPALPPETPSGGILTEIMEKA